MTRPGGEGVDGGTTIRSGLSCGLFSEKTTLALCSDFGEYQLAVLTGTAREQII
jgi:hypothetical protein